KVSLLLRADCLVFCARSQSGERRKFDSRTHRDAVRRSSTHRVAPFPVQRTGRKALPVLTGLRRRQGPFLGVSDCCPTEKRNWRGGTPVHRLNARVKELTSWYPNSHAISVMCRSRSAR